MPAVLACEAAFAQHQLWVRQAGSNSWDYTGALAPDGEGGVFAGGYHRYDAWLARYDESGHQLWFRKYGNGVDDRIHALVPDGAGGVFVGGDGLVQTDLANAWVARHNSAGDRLWIRYLVSNRREGIEALASDGAGGVFAGGVAFGPLVGPWFGSEDALLVRFDRDGTQLWALQLGTIGQEWIAGLAPDGAGGVFAGGITTSSFGSASAGNMDIWLGRFDSSGTLLRLMQFGKDKPDCLSAIAPDGSGGIFAGGCTGGVLAGAGAGATDAWLARFDAAGNRLWIRQFGTAHVDTLTALAADGHGGVIAAGGSEGNIAGQFSGGLNGWIARVDGAGGLLWIRKVGTPGIDWILGAAADGASHVYVGGETSSIFGGPNAGSFDAWVARWDGSGACYADCTGEGVVNLADLGCYLTAFNRMQPYAECNGDSYLDVLDLFCFQQKFALGCP